MKQSILVTALFLVAGAIDAGVIAERTRVPGFKLQLAEEEYLTTEYGVVIPAQVAKLEIGRAVKFYRTDGFCYRGRINEIEEAETYYKVYGSINNKENTQFGFAMVKGGIFTGAVVEKEGGVVYVLEFSDAHKGYVFVRSFKHEKGV